MERIAAEGSVRVPSAAVGQQAALVCAVIVAGGSGTRFGNPGGKQLVNVAGRPLMTWSVMAFDRSVLVGHIVVVCPRERRAEVRRLAIEPFAIKTPISFADAGETRQDSTAAGVDAVPMGFEYVAIHDGARPAHHNGGDRDNAICVLTGGPLARRRGVRPASHRYAEDRRRRAHRGGRRRAVCIGPRRPPQIFQRGCDAPRACGRPWPRASWGTDDASLV